MGAALSWINNCLADLDGVVDLLSAECSVVSIEPAYPAANVLDPDASLVCRINYTRNGAASGFVGLRCMWTNDAAGHRACRVVASPGIRVPAHATDIQMNVWAFPVPSQVGAHVVTQAQRVPRPEESDRFDLFGVYSADLQAGFFDLLVDLPPSVSGSVDIAYMHCGPALVFPDGVGEVWADEVIDPSPVEIGPSGAMAAAELPVRSAIEIPFDREDYARCFGVAGNPAAPSVRALRRQAGLHTPIVAIMRDATAFELQVHSVFGRITQLPRLVHDGGNLISTSMRVEQLRG
jgi:hypothetical protein